MTVPGSETGATAMREALERSHKAITAFEGWLAENLPDEALPIALALMLIDSRQKREAVLAVPALPGGDQRGGSDAAAILADACKPWEYHVGEPPADDSPLMGVYDAGLTYGFELLAKALGVERYDVADGSETWDGDVAGTLHNILIAGGVIDPETGERAKLPSEDPTPAFPSPRDGTGTGIPDPVRGAALELLLACEAEMSSDRDGVECPDDADDEAVAMTETGPSVVTFGHMRRLRRALFPGEVLTSAAPSSSPAHQDQGGA